MAMQQKREYLHGARAGEASVAIEKYFFGFVEVVEWRGWDLVLHGGTKT